MKLKLLSGILTIFTVGAVGSSVVFYNKYNDAKNQLDEKVTVINQLQSEVNKNQEEIEQLKETIESTENADNEGQEETQKSTEVTSKAINNKNKTTLYFMYLSILLLCKNRIIF